MNFAHENRLFETGDSILIAVSGGPDSTVLFHVLLSLKEKHQLTLIVAHVNYALRKKDSDQDERFVRMLCEKHGLPLFVLHPKTATTSEEALRDIRYDFFEKIADTHHCKNIAIAHSRDDQAETVLLRLLRGSGLEGLSAMQPKRGNVIRPLLNTPRKEILAYLKAEKIPFRTDTSNHDTRYLRNRVRHLLLPYLERKFQPNIREILARTASVITEERSVSDTMERIATIPYGKSSVSFSRKEFLALDTATRRQTLRQLHRKLLPENAAPELSFIKEALKLIESTKSKHQKASFRQLNIEAKGDRITLIRNR